MSQVNIRQIVMEMLLEVNKGTTYSHILVREVQNKYNYLSVQEKSFLKRLFEGTLERMIELDYCINQFSTVKVNKMKPVIRTIMRMSAYQILYMDSVPDSAACNEAVKLAQMKKFGSLKGFVNGVLRNLARSKTDITYPNPKKDFIQYLSVTYSMPEWIITLLRNQYDDQTVEEILKGLLEEHPVTIRCLAGIDKQEILDAINKAGMKTSQHIYFEDAYQLSGNMESVSDLPGFSEGKITVQDVSSMLAVKCADIKEGDYVIDVCAAPGGKTMLAAEACGETGFVLSRDLTDIKVNMILENLDRCHLENADAEVFDARELDEEQVGRADVVLADLPCSGLGVMGKKRDIKYHVSQDSLKELVELQKEILKTVTTYVKPGGILLYSTCTIHKGENEDMVQWIEKEFPEFTLESIEPFLPDTLPAKETAKDGYLQFLPGVHQTDGFFVSRFRKKNKD